MTGQQSNVISQSCWTTQITY